MMISIYTGVKCTQILNYCRIQQCLVIMTKVILNKEIPNISLTKLSRGRFKTPRKARLSTVYNP